MHLLLNMIRIIQKCIQVNTCIHFCIYFCIIFSYLKLIDRIPGLTQSWRTLSEFVLLFDILTDTLEYIFKKKKGIQKCIKVHKSVYNWIQVFTLVYIFVYTFVKPLCVRYIVDVRACKHCNNSYICTILFEDTDIHITTNNNKKHYGLLSVLSVTTVFYPTK